MAEGQRVEQAERQLAQFAFDIRIPVHVMCLPEPDADAVAHLSRDATFVFLPSRLRRIEVVGPFDLSTANLITRLPTSASILAGEKFVLVTSPENEMHQALLLAEERLDSAEQRHRSLANQLSKLQAALDDLVAGANDTAHPATEDDVAAAELRVQNVSRRLAKARANVDTARVELDRLTS